MKSDLAAQVSERASGVYRCAPLAAGVRGDIAPRAQLHGIVLRKTRDKNASLDAFAAALGFPDYFGHNSDAFCDCMGDVKGDQLVLLLHSPSPFASAEPEEFATA